MYPLVSCDIPSNRCLLSLLTSLILICVFLSVCALAYAFAICWPIIGSFHNPFDWWQWLIIIVNTLMIPYSKDRINRRNCSPKTTQFVCNSSSDNWRLLFFPHIQSISTKADARYRVLASLTSKEWEWRKDQLMKVYKALQVSLLTYAAPAWQPWAALSRIEQLERCQNKAMRVVTGQFKSTPVETLRREAGICSIATASKRTTAE